MAIGFSPKHKETLYLDQFTLQQFLILAHESAKKLEWEICFISETGFIAFLNKGRFKWNAEITFTIEGDHASVISTSVGSEFFDWGKNRKNIERFRDVLIDFKYALTPAELDRKFEELKPNLAVAEHDILNQPQRNTPGKINDALSIFVPRNGYLITPIIINLNILIYLLMIFSGVHFMQPDGESLLKWGANFRPVTLEGEWWRLITNCFLHIGILHLLLNMYALTYIGLLLEPRIGSIRFAYAYFIAGFTASITSVCWHELTISAGASGAIFGMYGVFLALLTTRLIDKTTRKDLLASIGIFIGYNLLYGMKGGIDNAAHIGGLLGGIMIGFSMCPTLVKPDLKVRNLLVGMTTLIGVAALSVFFIWRTPNPIGKYDQIIGKFVEAEEKAMRFYRLEENSSDELYLRAIREDGIPNWNVCKKLALSIDSLERLPEDLADRASLLIKYCDYRIATFTFMAESIEEQSHGFDFMILHYNQKIDLIIKRLNGEAIADSLLIANPIMALMPNIPPGILFVVDGTPVNDIQNLNPEIIGEINFLVPEVAFNLYGDLGKNGALIIRTNK